MSSLLNQPAGLFADPREAWLANLLDPRVGHRSAILPLVEVGGDDTGRGSVEFGAPQFLVDMLKSAMLPGAAAQGYQPAPEEVTQMAMDTMLGGGLLGRAPSGALGMNLWHGGPHKWAPEPDFPHGRPRLDKMGTGEGNQAYGHGFYSAEAPGVARDYQKRLSPGDVLMRKDGTVVPRSAPGQGDAAGVFSDFAGGYGNLDDAAASLKDQIRTLDDGTSIYYTIKRDAGAPSPKQLRERYAAALDWFDSNRDNLIIDRQHGALYKLDIPDADVAKYLDWDAPLSEQPEAVRLAIETLPDYARPLDATEAANVTGQRLYQRLSNRFGDEGASEALRKAGIPGLKYFDGSSRGKGEGTRNYVTWDQDVLDRSKILERDGSTLGVNSEK